MELNVSENTFLCQDFLLKNFSSDLSIKKWLQQKLYAVVSSSNRKSQKISNSNELLLDFTSSEIPLYRLKSHVGYRCPIALQLTRRQGLSSFTIAEQLLSDLISLCPDFTILIQESGWLDFYPRDRALAIWLQQISQITSYLKKEFVKEILPNFFTLQYTHARCCSLLHLGHRERLIQINETLQWKHPDPVPWLDKDGKFRLVQPTERYLIEQILEVVDDFDSEKIDWIKLADRLSKAVLKCDRDCRIWGEVKRNTPELSQARLGLYAIAQILLQKLLEEKIGIWAPVEL